MKARDAEGLLRRAHYVYLVRLASVPKGSSPVSIRFEVVESFRGDPKALPRSMKYHDTVKGWRAGDLFLVISQGDKHFGSTTDSFQIGQSIQGQAGHRGWLGWRYGDFSVFSDGAKRELILKAVSANLHKDGTPPSPPARRQMTERALRTNPPKEKETEFGSASSAAPATASPTSDNTVTVVAVVIAGIAGFAVGAAVFRRRTAKP